MREKMASGGSRPFLLSVFLTCAMLFPVPALAVGDGQMAPNAAVQAFKLKFWYASDAAYITARTAAYRTAGVLYPAVADGEFYYRTSDNVIRYYDGTTPYNAANWATYSPGAGAGQTLDESYTAGQSITRDLGALTISDATAGASNTFVLNRTAGTGAVIDLSNAGTGNDITGDAWSISTAGAIGATGLDLAADGQLITLGTSDDATLSWDGTSLVLTALADNQELDMGVDATGWDQQWHTGTAGDYLRFDASDKMLYTIDAILKLGTSDAIYFGDGSGGAAAVDGDWSVYSDGTNLLLIPEAAGTNNIVVGADGDGADFTIYGDGVGTSLKWDYNATADTLVLTEGAGVQAGIQIDDAASLVFGAGSDVTGDMSFEYVGGTNTLSVLQTVSGTGSVAYGVDGKGIDQTWYGETASSAWTFDQDTDRLYAAASHLHMGDASEVRMGNGTGTNGDMVLAYSAANVLSLTQTSTGAGADGTGTLVLGSSGEGFDVTFHGETAADQMMWDNDLDGAGGGALAGLVFSGGTVLNGDAGFSIAIGATAPAAPADGFQFTSSATTMGINSVAGAAGDTILVGNVADTDLALWGTNGGGAAQAEVSWNYGADLLTFDGSSNVRLLDGRNLQFGTGPATNADIYMAWENVAGVPAADALHIAPTAAADVDVVLGTDGGADGVDLYLLSDTPGDYLRWNSDAWTLQSVDALIALGDGSATDDALLFGAAAGGDVQMFYDGALNDLNLLFAAAGGIINLGGGAGAATDVNWAPGMVQRVTFDDDDAGGAAPFVQHVGVYSTYGSGAPLYFDPTAADLPVDGMVIDSDSSAATDALYLSSVAGTEGDAVVFGYDGAAARATDVSFYGTNGAGADAITMSWDYSVDSLNFSDADAGAWFAAQAQVSFGGTQAAPLYTIADNAGSELEIATGGAANGTLQIGMSAANTQIVTDFGNTAAAAIRVNPNAAAGTQIKYLTQKPVEQIFLSAAEFMPGLGAPTGVVAGASYGWKLEENGGATDESVQTFWQPPKWVDTTSDINVYAMFSCDNTGNVNWQLHRLKTTPGTSTAADVDAAPSAKTSACAVAGTVYDTSAVSFTIASALLTTSALRPLRIEVLRETSDTNVGDCWFYGLNMEVTRMYAD